MVDWLRKLLGLGLVIFSGKFLADLLDLLLEFGWHVLDEEVFFLFDL